MRKENKNMTLNPSSSSKGPKLPKHSNLIDARRKSNNSKLAAKKVISSERILDKLSPRVVSSFANQYSQFKNDLNKKLRITPTGTYGNSTPLE